MTKALSIDVKNKTVSRLMKEDISTGKFHLPCFQRQFVWNTEDIKQLFDSMVNNYPIGTIILWKPSKSAAKDMDQFSSRLWDAPTGQPSETLFIIDGQQRLTSLLLLFNHWGIKREGKDLKCEVPITFDPGTAKFFKGQTRGYDLAFLVDAYYRLNTDALNRLTGEVPKDKRETMEDSVGRILGYNLPMYIMETTEEDELTYSQMAEAFIRVNKYGERIGNLELMLSFLAGTVQGSLKQSIQNIYQNNYERFEIELQPVIRLAFSGLGLKQTQISKIEQFKKNISRIGESNHEDSLLSLELSNRGLKLALDFLDLNLGINNSRLLPSQASLVPLAAYLSKVETDSIDKLTSEEVQRMADWLVLVNFTGFYSSTTETKLDKDIEAVRSSDRFPLEELHANIRARKGRPYITPEDIRKGRQVNIFMNEGRAFTFLLYILLNKKSADDWNGAILGKKKYGNLARHHIFPYDYLKNNLELDADDRRELDINNLANITWINESVNSEIESRAPSDYLRDYMSSGINHFIPEDKTLWTIDRYYDFLEWRMNMIIEEARDHLPGIFLKEP